MTGDADHPDDLESAVLVGRDLSGHVPGRTEIYRLIWATNGPNRARTSGDRQVPPPLPRSPLLQRHSVAVYPATTSPWRDVPPPLFFPLGDSVPGLRPQTSAQTALRIADIDIMRGAGTATTGQAAWLRQ